MRIVQIFLKSFKIIDAFYSSIKRSDLKIDNIENFINNLLEKFQDYLTMYNQEIIDLISDDKFDENVEFNLSNLE